MVSKIKVLHICSYYYGTKLYKNLMENLEKNECDITVFAPCSFKSNSNESEKYLIKSKCFNKIDRFCFKNKHKKIYNSLINIVEPKDYGLLHAHSLFSNGYIAYKIFKNYNIPYIVAVRNTDINIFFKYFLHLRKLGIEILENASKIIFISNAYKEKLVDKYIPKEKMEKLLEKSFVIPNGIDNYFLENKKNGKKLQKNKLNLVYTGRVDKNKNLITTIKCCEKFLKDTYDVKLTVIGKIVSKNYLKIIEKYDFINYVGTKNKEEIVKLYEDMNIFVMPSKHETFGLTYAEAMTQGLPVIYTRGEGFDQYFEEGRVGYSVKYNNEKEIAEKIELIIKNYENISKNCVDNVKDFNWNSISLTYIDIYNSIMKEK